MCYNFEKYNNQPILDWYINVRVKAEGTFSYVRVESSLFYKILPTFDNISTYVKYTKSD